MSTVGDSVRGRPAITGTNGRPWWNSAAIYQVYIRSFADGNSDGIGDLEGCRLRLPYLADLGIDAIWFNPWYQSPMADGGYDVADYRAIEPQFGTLEEAEKLLEEAHALGIRIILDIVPNHGSDRQAWFVEALASTPGSPERDRFHFRRGRGEQRELQPNNWQSIFGGPAWTRTASADGAPGEWYLHLFASEQPDFNWDNDEVRAEFESVLRFWFDRGVDGFRIDSAALLSKEATLADLAADADDHPGQHPFADRDEVHEIYRGWRKVADSYPEKRLLIGEVWLPDVERFALYLRSDELHSAFNFDFLCCAFEAPALRRVIDATISSHSQLGARPTWVLSNHDVVRHVTRYGRADTSFDMGNRRIGEPSDLVLGARRARAAALLSLSLPGAVYIYQGDELGLWEVEDLPDELLQDPMWHRSEHKDRGRDGCRVPIPWSGRDQPFGFSPDGAQPWLPQPAGWRTLTAEAEKEDPGSMLALYRSALSLRHHETAFSTDYLEWLEAPMGALCYQRGADIVVLVNLSAGPVAVPEGHAVLLSSGPLGQPDGAEHGRSLPADTAVWLRSSRNQPEGLADVKSSDA